MKIFTYKILHLWQVRAIWLVFLFYIIYFFIFVNNNIGDNMKNSSIWNNLKEYKLNNSSKKNTDILIVGGGITGITLGYLLKDINKDVTIVDKSNIGRGVTSLSSAKISYIQKDIYQKLNKKYGLENVKPLALEYIDKMCRTFTSIELKEKFNQLVIDVFETNKDENSLEMDNDYTDI